MSDSLASFSNVFLSRLRLRSVWCMSVSYIVPREPLRLCVYAMLLFVYVVHLAFVRVSVFYAVSGVCVSVFMSCFVCRTVLRLSWMCLRLSVSVSCILRLSASVPVVSCVRVSPHHLRSHLACLSLWCMSRICVSGSACGLHLACVCFGVSRCRRRTSAAWPRLCVYAASVLDSLRVSPDTLRLHLACLRLLLQVSVRGTFCVVTSVCLCVCCKHCMFLCVSQSLQQLLLGACPKTGQISTWVY